MTPASRDALNRDVVHAELGVLRARLRREATDVAAERLEEVRGRLDGPSTLDEVSNGFGLTPFERAVLLLAAGPELVGEVGGEIAAAYTLRDLADTPGREITELPEPGAGRATFGLALAVVPDAHWSAVTPPAPLRHWDLVRLAEPTSPTHSPLLVDERVLHHIAGAGHLDAGLAAVSRPVSAPRWLPQSLAGASDVIVDAWRRGRPAMVHGPQRSNVMAVLGSAADQVGLTALALTVADVPTVPLERERFLRHMERESVLAGCAWIVDFDRAPRDEAAATARALAGLHAPVAVIQAETDIDSPWEAVDVELQRLEVGERREVFASALRRADCSIPSQESDTAAGVFDLPLGDVEEVAREVAAGKPLWTACRSRTRSQFGPLATVVAPRATWDDLVLPAHQIDQLWALVASVRQRSRVLDDWGFAQRGPRGLGSTALFTGPSGTGKTLAAEVVARELQLDLLQVDLSQVVSKYIGETEKQLRRLFDAAEDGGSMLLFDEADALFGKRSEVRDSHDRYANLEVGYLLQRMEAFRGLAILTTNARSALDPAFPRRLRTIIAFPYPDPVLREHLWRGVFPADTPTDDLDARRLAGIDVPGGGIAAIALTAAYLAADQGDVVGGDHVQRAARWELAKAGRRGRAERGGS